MKSKQAGTPAYARLMESDPSAYFEKLLLELDQLEERMGKGRERSGGGLTAQAMKGDRPTAADGGASTADGPQGAHRRNR
ncbi:MAG TPA: hypothetical protein VLR71_13205 [Casimicrobiaceae bacterium]|nr:hypothetical protein [Casimicrobiaceae bacterium]